MEMFNDSEVGLSGGKLGIFNFVPINFPVSSEIPFPSFPITIIPFGESFVL